MTGITDLQQLLASMKPEINHKSWVFCTIDKPLCVEFIKLNPLVTVQEKEGLTLILEKAVAEKAGFTFEGEFNCISLTVHSSLEAVGLTAAISTALAKENISANVVAGYYHDHVLVPVADADRAMAILESFSV